MDYSQNLSESDRRWFDLIQQCRASGKPDYQWLQENNISASTFYYHIRQLRKKACEIPQSDRSGKSDTQEVVPLIIEEPEPVSEPVPVNSMTDPATVRLRIHGISIEITNAATQEIIQDTLSALRMIC